jgi:hypothetical protein
MIREDSQPVITGPRKTSRLGTILVIDLTAPQANLVVERGSNVPRASVVVTTSARRIIELSKDGQKLDHIAVIGSTDDPTTHPNLREITENLRALRTKWFPRAKLCMLSSGKDLASYDLRAALGLYDKIFLDYEWGTAKTFTTMTGKKSTAFASLTKHMGSLDHLIVQAHFVRGDFDNSTPTEVQGWIRKLQELRPQEVHILTGAPDVDGKKLKAVTKTRHKQIADQVSETGLSVAIHDDEALVV